MISEGPGLLAWENMSDERSVEETPRNEAMLLQNPGEHHPYQMPDQGHVVRATVPALQSGLQPLLDALVEPLLQRMDVEGVQ